MTDLGHRGYKEQFSVFGDPDAQDPDPEVRKRFFGKYQGSVRDNVDPLFQGRLLVCVPDVTGFFTSSWAMPCVPMAGPLQGTSFVPPPIGTGVWVEYEQGDSERPIWVGCFWGPGQVPAGARLMATQAPGVPAISLETLGSGVSICDQPLLGLGNVVLHALASMITIGEDAITLTAPEVRIATARFSINGTAFNVV
jgi:hypothetical protein